MLKRGEQMELVASPLTTDEARALTERIKRHAQDLWHLLLEAYERRAWEALNYSSWREYAEREFQISQARAYQLLDAARVQQALEEAGVSTIVEIPESHARELAPLRDEPEKMAEAWQTAVDHSNGRPTAEAVREAVDLVRDRTEQRQQDREELQALAAELTPPDFDPAENADQVRQRGEFSRLCRDIAALPAPASFITRHAGRLDGEHISEARAAYIWLGDFFKEWSER